MVALTHYLVYHVTPPLYSVYIYGYKIMDIILLPCHQNLAASYAAVCEIPDP